MTEEKRTTYNALIGRIGNEYYFLKDVFDHGDGFKGATGSILVPLTEEELEERNTQANSIDELRDYWKEAVATGRTEESLETWAEQVRDEQGESAGIDESYSNTLGKILSEKLGEEACYATDCVGGGRCFKKGMKFDKVYRPDLIKIIDEYES